MARHLDKLFTQALTQEAKAQHAAARPPPVVAAADGPDDAPSDLTACEQLLDAFTRKDYATCLSLPPVTLDAVGKPLWAVTDAELSRAYRKASLGVHPDKNPAPEARRAFDALKEAHKLLQDGASRREYEQQEGEKLLQKVAAERPEELVRMKRAREAQEAAAFADDVRAQAARQAERARLRKQQAAQWAAKRAEEGEQDGDSEGAGDDGGEQGAPRRSEPPAVVRGASHAAKRGRRTFLF